MKSRSTNIKNGFTLIELLVVISIIGVLVALSVASYSSTQKMARDTGRKSDIKQYQNSLEIYANKNNGLFPMRAVSGGVSLPTLCGALGLTGCPEDPLNSGDYTYSYRYRSDGTLPNGVATATKYVMWAKLESVTNYLVVCSDGKNGEILQSVWVNPSGDCPLP